MSGWSTCLRSWRSPSIASGDGYAHNPQSLSSSAPLVTALLTSVGPRALRCLQCPFRTDYGRWRRASLEKMRVEAVRRLQPPTCLPTRSEMLPRYYKRASVSLASCVAGETAGAERGGGVRPTGGAEVLLRLQQPGQLRAAPHRDGGAAQGSPRGGRERDGASGDRVLLHGELGLAWHHSRSAVPHPAPPRLSGRLDVRV